MTPRDIYLARFPYGGMPGSKVRPTLVLTTGHGNVPEYVIAYMSSKIRMPLIASDILIDPRKPLFRSTRLKQVTVLRLHKIPTVHESDILTRIGRLEQATMAIVKDIIRILFNL